MDQFTPLVFDLGSSTVRAGWAGHDQPVVIENSMLGKRAGGAIDPTPIRLMGAGVKKFEGIEPYRVVEFHKNTSTGSCTWSLDKDMLNSLTDAVLYSQKSGAGLQCNPYDRGVISTCPPGADSRYKRALYEHFMEKTESPMFFLADSSVLSLYASGMVSGVHLDIGAACTAISVVSKGETVHVEQFPVAGDAIDRYVLDQVGNFGSSQSGINHIPSMLALDCTASFSQQLKLAYARDIKQSACKCSHHALHMPPLSPMSSPTSGPKGSAARATTRSTASKKASSDTQMLGMPVTPAATSVSMPVMYKLPDGTDIDVGPIVERAPELLFTHSGGSFRGIANELSAVLASINEESSPSSNFVLLTGGSAHFQGLHTRLVHELEALRHTDTHVFPFTQWTHRPYSAFTGASILASLSTFASLWVTPASYKEHGVDRLVLAK